MCQTTCCVLPRSDWPLKRRKVFAILLSVLFRFLPRIFCLFVCFFCFCFQFVRNKMANKRWLSTGFVCSSKRREIMVDVCLVAKSAIPISSSANSNNC